MMMEMVDAGLAWPVMAVATVTATVVAETAEMTVTLRVKTRIDEVDAAALGRSRSL
jgi:hypothetical protein